MGGSPRGWLKQGVSYDRLRRWQVAVFEGDLDRRLIPREGSPMTVPPAKRTALERTPAAERAAHEADVAKLSERIRELDGSSHRHLNPPHSLAKTTNTSLYVRRSSRTHARQYVRVFVR